MYDKGNNLRIEVTINNPKDFKILKTKEKVQEGKIVQTKEWEGIFRIQSIVWRNRYGIICHSQWGFYSEWF